MPPSTMDFPVLRLPNLRLRSSYTLLLFPNAVDTWISSSPVKICADCLGPTIGYLGDVPSNQVVATVQHHAAPRQESCLTVMDAGIQC